ncbi:MAG: tRNA (adenosine(37)-N6)-threonylcarbamoyltransferase complex ATPase subunit type 1 TsaE [Actinomycetota bacterium]|nr:tRNA (adenosine(37)-N6)-threonylcarbamoyltransferase complex ATPase subunit type 1 TsaE [Actinomycetota bacterium]
MVNNAPDMGAKFIEFTVTGEEAMVELGISIGSSIVTPVLITLLGDLGAGKTTLAKGIIAGQGVDEVVTSPTFIIQREYEGNLPIRHLDLYRFSGARSLDLMDIDLFDDGTLRLVEWPNAVDFIIEADIQIEVDSIMDGEARFIHLSIAPHVDHRIFEKLSTFANRSQS